MCQKHSKFNMKGQILRLHCNGCHGKDPTFLVHFIFHEVSGQGMSWTFTSPSHLYFKVYHRLCSYQEHFSPVLFKAPLTLTCVLGEYWCSPVNKIWEWALARRGMKCRCVSTPIHHGSTPWKRPGLHIQSLLLWLGRQPRGEELD